MKKSRLLNLFLNFTLLGLIIYNIYLGSVIILKGDIGFNTDLARDFLLMQEMQTENKVPLIGPRSGGIPGVFHGPLWSYINFPAYLAGNGNPIVVGWFWIILNILLIYICFYVGKKVYGTRIGILSALLISSISVPWIHSLFNPFGAVLLSPLFIYLLSKYVKSAQSKYLILSSLVLGLTLQFQIAFAAPLILLFVLFVVIYAFRKKRLKHLFSLAILLVPLSTHLVFELRHQLLQTKATISYVFDSKKVIENYSLFNFLENRFEGFINGLVAVPYPNLLLSLSILAVFGFLLVNNVFRYKKKDVFLGLFLYFYIGFWAFSFAFKGVVWNYYYWPFVPISAIIIASSFKRINKYLFIPLFAVILFISISYSNRFVSQYVISQLGKDAGSWLFNYKIAQHVFSQNDNEFGYYVFSPDEFGYSPRYAMDYVGKLYPNINSLPFEKRRITYLLISPPGGKDNGINGDWWKTNRVKLIKKPETSWFFDNGFAIEKYKLTQEEINLPSDPNLINSLFFR